MPNTFSHRLRRTGGPARGVPSPDIGGCGSPKEGGVAVPSAVVLAPLLLFACARGVVKPADDGGGGGGGGELVAAAAPPVGCSLRGVEIFTGAGLIIAPIVE